MALVTIGLPFYNDEKTLNYALKSILLQSFHDWELILVDDGSTDNSLNLVKDIQDSRIKVISDGMNYGLASRLNQIAKLSNSKYIARMDADDIMHPKRLEYEVEYLEKYTKIDVVGSEAYSIDLNNKILGKKKCLTKIPSNWKQVIYQSIFIHPTILGKREWFLKFPYEEEKWANRAEDFELWCRSFPTSNFYIINKPLIFYRENSSFNKSYKNYLLTYHNVSVIQEKYKGKILSVFEYKKLIMLYKMKKVLFHIVLSFKLDKLFLRKRFYLLSNTELNDAKVILDKLVK